MKKPQKQKIETYDYHECVDYLEKKHGYDTRDYSKREEFWKNCKKQTNDKFGANGWYTTKPEFFTDEQKAASDYYDKLLKNEPPLLDFWFTLLNKYDIKNDSYFTMDKSDFFDDCFCDTEPWEKQIAQNFFDEFDPENTGEITFYVSW